MPRPPIRPSRLCGLLITLASASAAMAGPAAAPAPAAPAAAPSPQTATQARPLWHELTAQQRQILTPVAGEWNSFSVQKKQRLLNVVKRYPDMSPAEQAEFRRLLEHVRDNLLDARQN